MALGLAFALPDGFGLVRPEPVFELLAGHVHGPFELVYRLLTVVVRHPRPSSYALLNESGLWAASLPLFSLSTR